ncbi:Xaa-Pro aminopeptidase [Fulvitalea axinellae]|uniref:Xaa-Pro aminopeptidase n=1 Tax=Fulvitalea axinellae TaxID=1182444 RepID=A0AAU9CEU7_9BACT|nr:Xaa-Pro aminopeptidase [Fulvitalea axinellae]
MSFFPKETYVARRRKLAESIGKGTVLLLGNDNVGMNYTDNHYPFRQDSTFLYFFGINKPGLAGTINTETGEAKIFGDDLSIDDIVWTGPMPNLSELATCAGVTVTAPSNKLVEEIAKCQIQNQPIHYIPQYRHRNLIKTADLLDIPINQVNLNASVTLIKGIVALRSIKSEEEIVEIEKAVNLSLDMHEAAIAMARPGVNENTIAAKIRQVAEAAGGTLSFPTIATIRGEILHNHYTGNTLQEGDLLLLDAGAEVRSGYAGDLSSTIPVSGQFTARQREVYDVVYSAHLAAMDTLKPGTEFTETHRAACLKIAEGMNSLGLMKGDPAEAVAQGAHALFFQCGTGHMMGLDVHDMENLGEQYVGYTDTKLKSTQFGLKSLRLGKALEPGFVVTVEPGIYFIPELIDRWKAEKKFEDFINYSEVEKYKDFGGIRNEEDVLITKDGSRTLGRKKTQSADELESLMASITETV